MISEIAYVTGNVGKFEMVKHYLNAHSSLTISQIDIPLIEEQDLSLSEIAVSKAHQAWSILQKPLLVDDSGIYFDRYHQFPGIMTKFLYQSLGFEGLYRLYEVGDSASFITYLVYMDNKNSYHIFEGKVEGTLIKPHLESTPQNLPYTHLIIPRGTTQTLHESMQKTGYSKYNPRIIALQKFVKYSKNL